MDEYKPRDKKVQSNTTVSVLKALNAICTEEQKTMSTVIHDALVEYTSTYGGIQMTLKQNIIIENFNTKIQYINENTSDSNKFKHFEMNFIEICMNLNDYKDSDLNETAEIGDLILLLSEIKAFKHKEYTKCVLIARKLLSKHTFERIFPNESKTNGKKQNKW